MKNKATAKRQEDPAPGARGPNRSWIEKAAPPGSNQFYALLFAEKEKHEILGAMLALQREITASARAPSEAGVANLKLAWWGEEAGLLSEGRPRHPVTRALHAASLPADELRISLDEMLDCARQEMVRTGYEDESRWLRYCGRSGGSVQRLLAVAQSPGSGGLLNDYANRLGTGIRIIEILANVRADAHAGLVFLPLDSLATANTGLAHLRGPERPPELVAVLRECAGHARRSIADAFEFLPAAERTGQRYGLVLSALHLQALSALERDGFPSDAGLAYVHPLRKLWAAWRSARGALAERAPKV